MNKPEQFNFLLKQLNPEQPINLVLSGGGTKGVAHIALLEYLEEREIKINQIVGSSAGSLVGALYCSGLRPKEILSFFKSTPIFRYTWLTPSKAGIFDSSKYVSVIDKFVKSNFDQLDIPLTITTTNIQKNKVVFFEQGDLIQPLLASCAVPAVFAPIVINDELYSDGGVMDNFPISPVLSSPYRIIGSYVSKPKQKKHRELNTTLKVTNHSNALLHYSANAYKFKQTYATIDFPLGKYGVFDTKKIKKIYKTARQYLNQ